MNTSTSSVVTGESGTPRLTIVMPVFNGERYLSEAIESILNQTLKEFEFIIIDDGSTDNSLRILSEYQKGDPRIRLSSRENKGLAATLNELVDLARCKYIVRMDQDDICSPDRLEKQVSYIDAHPEVWLVSSNAEIITADGNHLLNVAFPSSHALLLWTMCFTDPILHPTVLMQRSAVIQVGGYRNLLPSGERGFPEDYDLWTRMIRMKHARFYNLPDRLMKLRKHESNITNLNLETILRNSAVISQCHMEYLLKHDVLIEIPQIFWNQINDTLFIQPTMKLLNELIQLFFQEYPLTNKEKRIIRKDAAWRLIQILPGQLTSKYAPNILWQAFLYDPFFLWNAFLNLLPRASSKLLRVMHKRSSIFG